MDQQDLNWFIINEQIKKLEQEEYLVKDDQISYQEWKDKWNALISLSSKIAGCLKREKK